MIKDKFPFISELQKIYEPFAPEWVRKNSILFNFTRKHNLALGGSIAMAITRKKSTKFPGDLDLFTNSNEDALKFVNAIVSFLSKKSGSFYRIYVNNETEWCMEGVKHHYRIVGPPYWLPICVMVLKKPIRFFVWNRHRVQYFDDVVKSAKEATAKDGKVRINFNESLDTSEKLSRVTESRDTFSDHSFSENKILTT